MPCGAVATSHGRRQGPVATPDKPAISRAGQTPRRGARPPPARRPQRGGARCAVFRACSPCSAPFSLAWSSLPPRDRGPEARRTSARAGRRLPRLRQAVLLRRSSPSAGADRYSGIGGSQARPASMPPSRVSLWARESGSRERCTRKTATTLTIRPCFGRRRLLRIRMGSVSRQAFQPPPTQRPGHRHARPRRQADVLPRPGIRRPRSRTGRSRAAAGGTLRVHGNHRHR